MENDEIVCNFVSSKLAKFDNRELTLAQLKNEIYSKEVNIHLPPKQSKCVLTFIRKIASGKKRCFLRDYINHTGFPNRKKLNLAKILSKFPQPKDPNSQRPQKWRNLWKYFPEDNRDALRGYDTCYLFLILNTHSDSSLNFKVILEKANFGYRLRGAGSYFPRILRKLLV